MQERAPTAFFCSVALHGTVVALIAALAFVVQHQARPPMQVFELVAGPPTDATATEAPALGRPEGTVEVKVNQPVAPRAPVVAEPVAPPAPQPPVAAKPAATAPAAVKTTVHAPSHKEIQRMTYKEYVKRYGPPPKPGATAGGGAAALSRPAPKIDVRGIAEGVLGGSSRSKGGGGGHALTATQRSELEAYIARLVMALRQNHQKPPGLSDLLAADIEFFIAADGTISQVHVSRSSGNADFDQSCVEAFRQVGSVGPKPDGKSDTWVLTFRMKDE